MTRNSGFRAVIGLATMALIGATTACGGGTGGAKATGPIKVGVPLGLTGPAASVADWARMGVEMSAAEINTAGGINGRKIKLVFEDTGLDPTKAVMAVNRLINQEKVELIVGPMTSDETLATLPATAKAHIASINGSGSAITPQVAPYSFAMLMNAQDQAQKMVEYALDKYHAKSIATLNYSATQGKIAGAAFLSALKSRGMKPVATQEYKFPTSDLTPQLLALKKSNPDVLVSFNTTGDDTGRLVLGLRQLNWNVPVIGGYGTTFAAQAKGVAGADTYANLKSVTWSAFSACSASQVRPQATDFIKRVQASYGAQRLKNASYDYLAVYRDALFILKAGIEATKSTDGAKVTHWIEDNGAQASKSLSLVHQGYAMSKTNHFLMDTSSLTLVDPGQEIAPGIFRRLDCGK
jgi:branched-chain amino acid transport system substrate-binding protein